MPAFKPSRIRVTPARTFCDVSASSVRTDAQEPVVFTTERELRIVACSLAQVRTGIPASGQPGGEQITDHTGNLRSGAAVECFQAEPQVGDAVYFGLSAAVPGCAVLLRMDCQAEGVGVDPTDPPWAWEAWTGNGWSRCEVDADTTGGFNRSGDVILHVPPTHDMSLLRDRPAAGWLRCRVTHPANGQRVYGSSPRLRTATAATIGGTVTAVHAEIVHDEVLGMSEGVPGQRFPFARPSVVAADEPLVVQVAGGDGWDDWHEVASFAHSGPNDRHIVTDRVTGEVAFGPAIREPDGSLTYRGAVPPKGAPIRVPHYLAGGGRRGNVARDVLQVQRDPVPFVSTVTNRRPAHGGVDGESVRDAQIRGPLLLRTRERAVTAEDYEQLAREAAPDAARVRCVPADDSSDAVRVLVVPAVATSAEVRLAELRPSEALVRRISQCLDQRRCLGARISVEPPFYQGVTVIAKIKARPRTVPQALQSRAVEALYAYLDPVRGGPDGDGWPFGRPVQSGEIYAVLQRLSGVDRLELVRVYGADARTGTRGAAIDRLDLAANALVFSVGHDVRVEQG